MRIVVLAADPAHEASRARDNGEAFLQRGLSRLQATVTAVTSVLQGDGHAVMPLPANPDLPGAIARAAPDLVFNTYFGPARREDQAHVASLLEYAGVPFSGPAAACHFVGLSKPLSKWVLSAAGLPTAGFFVARAAADAAPGAEGADLRFPLIVKAPAEGEGIGLDERSVVTTRPELTAAVDRVIRGFSAPALVEEFLPGREFTVGVLDGEPPRVLPIMEIMVPPGGVFSFQAKTEDSIREACPAAIPDSHAEVMGQLAIRAGRAIGCRDYWRVDVRMDAEGSARVLEVNTLPGLQPGYSDITRMLAPAGLSYPELVRAILQSADARRTRP